MRRACVTGITGQDGSYMAELLVEKGYEVHGLDRAGRPRGAARTGLSRLTSVLDKLHLHPADLESFPSVHSSIDEIKPQELYHLAARVFAFRSRMPPRRSSRTSMGRTMCWNQFGNVYRIAESSSRRRARCSARPLNRRNRKRPPSIPARHTGSRRWPASTWPEATERSMKCSCVRESFSITNRRGAA